MFFYLSKILVFIISPLSWIIFLMIYGLFTKDQRKRTKLFIAALSLLVFFSNSFLLNELMRKWEIPIKKEADLEQVYDVGIVLGGLSTFDGDHSRIQFLRSGDRLFQAIDLYKKGRIKKILISGGSGSISLPDLKEAPIINRYLLDLGIPQNDIILEAQSKNTRENALFTSRILKNNYPGGKYLLITSSFHLRRATACFKKVGIETNSYATDRISESRKFLFDELFIPNIEKLGYWTVLIHEITGYIVYKMMGYA